MINMGPHRPYIGTIFGIALMMYVYIEHINVFVMMFHIHTFWNDIKNFNLKFKQNDITN